MTELISGSVSTPARDDLESDRLVETLLVLFAAIGRHIRRTAGRPAEFTQLTGAQLELVRLLRRRPGISVAEAADELHLVPNTVSTLVRRLADGGMIRRRSDASDRRVAQLELTEDTARTFDAFRDRRLLSLGVGVDRLTPEDRRALQRALPALEHLVATLREIGEAGEPDA